MSKKLTVAVGCAFIVAVLVGIFSMPAPAAAGQCGGPGDCWTCYYSPWSPSSYCKSITASGEGRCSCENRVWPNIGCDLRGEFCGIIIVTP